MNPSLAAMGPSALAILGCLLSSAMESPSAVAASPTHWEGEFGLRARAGMLLHPLGTEVSLSDSSEAWESPAQARVFLPWLLAQLTGKAEGNSPGWKLCGQKFC